MRPILKSEHIHPAIDNKVTQYQSDIVTEVQDAVMGNRIVVVGMRGNNSVRKARANLTKAGVDFVYLEYGSYLQGWYRRLAIKMWTGWPTFPMIFVDNTLIGGNAELEALISQKAL
ncbi:MAG: glutaredoxin [Candidatus Puniceispirillaceae bacterium]